MDAVPDGRDWTVHRPAGAVYGLGSMQGVTKEQIRGYGELPEHGGKKLCIWGAGEKALFPSQGEALLYFCGIVPAETGDQ